MVIASTTRPAKFFSSQVSQVTTSMARGPCRPCAAARRAYELKSVLGWQRGGHGDGLHGARIEQQVLAAGWHAARGPQHHVERGRLARIVPRELPALAAVADFNF